MNIVHQEISQSEEIKAIWSLFRKTDEEIGNLSREVREVSRQVATLTGKWGRFVEGMIVPGMISMFGKRGIEIERLFQRVRVRKDDAEMEIDILGVNTDNVVLVEVKSTLSPDDVREHIERLKNFKHFFPEYADRHVIGAVAGIVIDGDADRFAYRQGLFVIGQKGENVRILNGSRFKPKHW
jgi:hypothetical protein